MRQLVPHHPRVPAVWKPLWAQGPDSRSDPVPSLAVHRLALCRPEVPALCARPRDASAGPASLQGPQRTRVWRGRAGCRQPGQPIRPCHQCNVRGFGRPEDHPRPPRWGRRLGELAASRGGNAKWFLTKGSQGGARRGRARTRAPTLVTTHVTHTSHTSCPIVRSFTQARVLSRSFTHGCRGVCILRRYITPSSPRNFDDTATFNRSHIIRFFARQSR